MARADRGGERYFAAEIAQGLAQRDHWFETSAQAAANVERAVQRALNRLVGEQGRRLRVVSVSMMPIVFSAGTPHESTWCMVGVVAEDSAGRAQKRTERQCTRGDKGMGEMAVINREGDTKISWDPEVEHEVEAARRMWNSLVRDKGYSAFSVRSDGSAGERVREFDPEHEKLILVPPMQGGA